MFCFMKVLSTLLCLLLLHQNESASCPPGHRLNYNTKICEVCPRDQYSSTPGTHFACQNCNRCKKGSKELKPCTSTSNTQCKCLEGFTPINRLDEDFCVCENGSGTDAKGICIKCQDGFFRDKDNSNCKKWRECKSGIAIPGTSTSDAVCKDASEEVTEAPKAHTTPFQTTTISSMATSRTTVSSPNITKIDGFYSLWLVMSCAGGVLLLAGLLYYNRKVTHCIHHHKKVDSRKESVCRKPVEESGEKCLSLLV